jgi:sec-independent protein translocase protein TatC
LKASSIKLLFKKASAILAPIMNEEFIYKPLAADKPLEKFERHNALIIFITELRKTVRALGISLLLVTVGIFFLSPELLKIVQKHLADQLYFFSVAGPFLAHVKLSLFASIYVLMPWIMAVLWRAMGKPFGVVGRQLFFFVLFTCLLFYAGTLFCYFITLPFGIKFLLGFGSAELHAVISIGRFVNFTTLFILAFGLIFELPIFMVFMAKVGLLSRSFYERNRRYAVLLIAILAALLTPTPDVVNMLLMGGPLYLLYEAGIVILRIMRIK